MSTSREPSLALVLTQAMRRHTDALRVAMPGKIQDFDSTTQTASVVPLLTPTDEVNGEDVATALPVLPGVPVLFPGGGGYATTYPVAAGDPCLLVFSDMSLDEWFASSAGETVTPVALDHHALHGAVAILGARNQAQALPEFDTSRAVFGAHGPRVACDGSAVHLGVAHNQSATEPALLGTAHKSAVDALVDAIGQALQTVLVTGTTAAGPVAFAGLPALSTAFSTAKAAFDAAQDKSQVVLVQR